MKKIVHILCYFIDLYIFYIVVCGFLTFVPNLNWDFPAIKIMYWFAGFNILPGNSLLNSFMPLAIIVSLIILRKLLYRLIGEGDKFFGYEVNPKENNNDNNLNKEDSENDNEDTDSSDADN